MSNSQADPSQSIWVATDADNALVRIKGRASFTIAPALKKLGSALIEQHCARIVLDMADCDGIDSTFLGVLAGLASKMKQKHANAVVMINLSPSIYENVCMLGLDRVIACHEAGKGSPDIQEKLGRLGELDPLNIDPVDAGITRETAIEAHEELIRSDERNLPRFKDVLTFLRESQDRTGT